MDTTIPRIPAFGPAAIVLSLAMSVAAQVEVVPPPARPPAAVQDPKPAPKEAPKKTANNGDGGETHVDDPAAMPTGDPLARVSTAGASQYCRLMTRQRPDQLMPGQSGTIDILMILVGDVVLPAPAPVTVQAEPQQGMVSVGSGTFRAAKPGRATTKAFAGRPVYDNTAVFEVPVTVSGDAKVGSLGQVTFAVTMDLYSGSSGQPIGRFLEHTACVVKIGESTAVQAADGAATAAASQPRSGDAPIATAPVPQAPPSAADPQAAPVPQAAPAMADSHPAPGTGAPIESGSELPIVWILGGAIAVGLVILLLFLQRPRR